MRRLPLVAIAGVAVLTASAIGSVLASSAQAATMPEHARRVLVLSLPSVSWEDLDLAQLPNLRHVLEQSAVADLTVRGAARHPTLGDGYVTIGAGTRSVSRAVEGGQCFQADEQFQGGPARDALALRTGGDTSTLGANAVVCLAQPAVISRNSHLLYDSQPGALGDALASNGVHRAVIGNADDAEPPHDDLWQRSVGLALAGRDGVVPDGAVGADLLVRDSAAPFGLRNDPGRVLAAFDRAWRGRTVVLVEASDLARFDEYHSLMSPAARAPLEQRLLGRFDSLVGQMLRRVDPRQDSVLVVGTSERSGANRLTVAALRGPGVKPGLAESDFTQRAGTAAMVDIGPTILAQLGIDAPARMEGRPLHFASTGGNFDARLSWLTDTNQRAQFRDKMISGVTTWFIVLEIILTICAVIAFVRLGRRSLIAIELAALTLLGFLPATYLAGLFPFNRWGSVPYWLFLFGVGLALALVAWFTTDRFGVATLIVALSVVVGVIMLDVMTGAHLQFNTVFGYSPTVGGRYAGLGNLGYSQLAAAAVLLAGLLAFRIGGRRGAWLAITLLALAVVVDGAPFFGSDVGGVLSMVPAYLVAGALLLGWRLRWRLIALYGGITLAVLAVFAAIDVTRPKDKETHLGRLINSGNGNGGFHHVSIVIQRKLAENIGVFKGSTWTLMLPVVLAGIAYLVYRAPGRLRGIRDRIPPLTAALVGFALVAFLGFALNDSGIAIPGVMLGILTPVIIVITIRGERDRLAKPELDDEILRLTTPAETRA
jgi:hypothetical protein